MIPTQALCSTGANIFLHQSGHSKGVAAPCPTPRPHLQSPYHMQRGQWAPSTGLGSIVLVGLGMKNPCHEFRIKEALKEELILSMDFLQHHKLLYDPKNPSAGGLSIVGPGHCHN